MIKMDLKSKGKELGLEVGTPTEVNSGLVRDRSQRE